MTVRVAINGFGRIGRLVLRSIVEHRPPRHRGGGDQRPRAGRDQRPPAALRLGARPLPGRGDRRRATRSTSASARSRSRRSATRPSCRTGSSASTSRWSAPASSPRRTTAKAHLEAGAKRVLVSAPCDGADKTIVFGVNHDTLTDDDLVVSNGSCTTNCLAPVAKVLLDTVGIERGYMTTIHAYTGDQPTLDTAAQRPLPRPRRGGVDDPDLDRRGQGHRPGAAGADRQARRRARSGCRPRTSR